MQRKFIYDWFDKEEGMAANRATIGYLVQLGGIAAVAAGVVLSMHHVAIGVAFLGGAVALYVGEKIRTTA